MKAHKKRVVYKCGKSFVTKTYYSRKDNTADRDRTAEYALRAIGRAVAGGVLRGAEKRARPKPEGEEHVEMPPARILENRRGLQMQRKRCLARNWLRWAVSCRMLRMKRQIMWQSTFHRLSRQHQRSRRR